MLLRGTYYRSQKKKHQDHTQTSFFFFSSPHHPRPHFRGQQSTTSMMQPPKSRPPSRLFNWLSQFTRRSSTESTSDDATTASTPPTPPHPPQPPRHDDTAGDSKSDPIAVPKGRPSITLSVGDTTDTFYSSSIPSSYGDRASSVYSRQQNRRSSVLSDLLNKSRPSADTQHDEDDDSPQQQRLGTSVPEQNNKRLSLTGTHTPLGTAHIPPFHNNHSNHSYHFHLHHSNNSQTSAQHQQSHRPSSVFSLPCHHQTKHTDEESSSIVSQQPPQQHSNHQQQHAPRPLEHRQLSSSSSTVYACRDDWPRADRMIIRQELVRLMVDR